MTKIFVTGDRALPPAAAFMVVAPILAKLMKDENTFITGDAPNGVERAVRFLVHENRLTVIKRSKDADGKIDFDSSCKEAAKLADEAVMIHPKPTETRAMAFVNKYFKKVTLPLQGLVKDNQIISEEEQKTFEAMTAGLTFDD